VQSESVAYGVAVCLQVVERRNQRDVYRIYKALQAIGADGAAADTVGYDGQATGLTPDFCDQ